MATAILSWLFGNYAISAENVYRCSACKYESAVLPETLDHPSAGENTEDLN